jgi:hypothetical protein
MPLRRVAYGSGGVVIETIITKAVWMPCAEVKFDSRRSTVLDLVVAVWFTGMLRPLTTSVEIYRRV